MSDQSRISSTAKGDCVDRQGWARAGAGAAFKNIDPKPPKAEAASNCQSQECWDGYACGPCEEGAVADKASNHRGHRKSAVDATLPTGHQAAGSATGGRLSANGWPRFEGSACPFENWVVFLDRHTHWGGASVNAQLKEGCVIVRKNWLVFVGVAGVTYAIALPSVAPAAVSETSSLSSCNTWSRNGYTMWDCVARNSFPAFYIGDYSKVYFDLLHKPGNTVKVSIAKKSFSGSHSSDSKSVVLSSGANPVFKEYSVTPSEVLRNASQWDYPYTWVGGAEELYGTVIVLND